MRLRRAVSTGLLYTVGVLASPVVAPGQASQLSFEAAGDGRIAAGIDGSVAFVYRHGDDVDLPYLVLFSPSGKQMLVEHPDPYPHHRCFWFADTVQLEGKRKVSFYNAWYSRLDKDDPRSAFRDHVRHVSDEAKPVGRDSIDIEMQLVWEMDQNVPVLDETRNMRVVAHGEGEYFIDATFTVTATYGDVSFVSDAVHYAWPYLRMTPEFSVKGGGNLSNSEGGVNQKATNMKPATWVDYTNTIEGVTEGLTVFSHPDNGHPHKWLTRDYGCFGPRRIDEKSGKKFTLKKGESIKQRVGVLVHRGDVEGGKVADRYEQYCRSELGVPAE